MERTPLDFIVLGLPRSATTWLANWLTTDRSLCLHDPFAHGLPETWPRDHRLRGIACTGAAMMPHWLGGYACPIAVIVRESEDCDRSLYRLGLPDTGLVQVALNESPGKRFAFDDLWSEHSARELWCYLLPSVPFDELRYRLLRDMNVQPLHPGRVNEATVQTLVDSGLFEGKL